MDTDGDWVNDLGNAFHCCCMHAKAPHPQLKSCQFLNWIQLWVLLIWLGPCKRKAPTIAHEMEEASLWPLSSSSFVRHNGDNSKQRFHFCHKSFNFDHHFATKTPFQSIKNRKGDLEHLEFFYSGTDKYPRNHKHQLSNCCIVSINAAPVHQISHKVLLKISFWFWSAIQKLCNINDDNTVYWY